MRDGQLAALLNVLVNSTGYEQNNARSLTLKHMRKHYPDKALTEVLLADDDAGAGMNISEVMQCVAAMKVEMHSMERELARIREQRDKLREKALGAEWRNWFNDTTLPLPGPARNGKYHYDVLAAIGESRVGRGWQSAFSYACRMAKRPMRQGALQDWERTRTPKVPADAIQLAATSPDFRVPPAHKWTTTDRKLVILRITEGRTDLEITDEFEQVGVFVSTEAVRSVRKKHAAESARVELPHAA